MHPKSPLVLGEQRQLIIRRHIKYTREYGKGCTKLTYHGVNFIEKTRSPDGNDTTRGH